MLVDPSELVAPGDGVEVKVLGIEAPGGAGSGRTARDRRISLSRRALETDPWEEAESRFPEGETVAGRVVRLEPYGAFVRLAPGLDGLVHVSELAPGRRIAHPREVVALGQDVEVRVLGVDPDKRRISLALAAETTDAPGAAEYDQGPEASGFGALADAFRRARKD